jgi:hypothetical protein
MEAFFYGISRCNRPPQSPRGVGRYLNIINVLPCETLLLQHTPVSRPGLSIWHVSWIRNSAGLPVWLDSWPYPKSSPEYTCFWRKLCYRSKLETRARQLSQQLWLGGLILMIDALVWHRVLHRRSSAFSSSGGQTCFSRPAARLYRWMFHL